MFGGPEKRGSPTSLSHVDSELRSRTARAGGGGGDPQGPYSAEEDEEVKSLSKTQYRMRQLQVHSCRILHRDLKTSNMSPGVQYPVEFSSDKICKSSVEHASFRCLDLLKPRLLDQDHRIVKARSPMSLNILLT